MYFCIQINASAYASAYSLFEINTQENTLHSHKELQNMYRQSPVKNQLAKIPQVIIIESIQLQTVLVRY